MNKRETDGRRDRVSTALLRFHPFEFDPAAGLVYRGDEETLLPPKAAHVLQLLLENAGQLVSKDELLETIWEDAYVTESSLTDAISLLRRVLGDDTRDPTFIQTLHRRGYRFIGSVEERAALAPDAESEATPSVEPGLPREGGLKVGDRLGNYEILGVLGAGAMGTVYRARDDTLDREVAVKLLAGDFAGDPERLGRLEREAKLLAAVSHPNIAAIYSLEEAAGITFPVLELVEGETLEERLRSGRMGVEEALETARQIALALEAAHEHSIIHRDLKPANIKMTPEGQVKVLDFGLAKGLEVAGFAEDAAESPTASVTIKGTGRGSIVGTVAYMSPEQARGKPVDKRTDIWAFGCVVFEMLTGKRAFQGETVTDILAAIVHQEPQWEALPPDTPLRIRELLKRCLNKQADERLRDVGECRIAVKEYLAAPEGEKRRALASAGTTTARGIPWKLVAPIAVASALLAALGVWITMPSPPEPVVSRFYIDYPPETTFESDSSLGIAISPDGKSVVFSANRQLWLRPLPDLVATPIRGTEHARVPFFSPDGQQLGFWGSDGQMKKVSITGGAPVALGSAPVMASGANWADDGYIYFGQGAGGILRVSEDGGEPEPVVEMEEGERAHGPQLLPGGEWVLFTLSSGGSWNDASIVAQPVSGGESKVLVARGTDGRYVPTGHIVYSLEGNLFAVPFDADSIEVTGGSVSMVEGVQQAVDTTGAGQYAFSDRGGLVYLPGGDPANANQLAWVNRNGQVELLPFEPSSSLNLDLSPDDRRIALEILGDDAEWDIWIYEVERGGSQVLLTTEGNNRWPVWSPDGEWVFFASDRGGNYDIWKQRADRSLDAELVLDTEAPVDPTSISANEERLLFETVSFPRRDVGMLALDTGDTEMLADTPAAEFAASFSPDGRFFAFMSNETGQMEVYAQEVSSGRTFQVSTTTRGGRFPRWSRDGREIYYGPFGSSGILVAAVDVESRSASEPLELSDIFRRPNSNFDVTADGQRFLVTVPAGSRDTGDMAPATPRINVILNWFEELKERVPAGR